MTLKFLEILHREDRIMVIFIVNDKMPFFKIIYFVYLNLFYLNIFLYDEIKKFRCKDFFISIM
jgi:hypothetical protein